MNWSKEIKNLREILCISQTELAQMLDVSFVSVNRWENGHFEPTIKIKRKIANILKRIENKAGNNNDYWKFKK